LPTYRIYRLDGVGNIEAADWIEADGDEEAVLQAHDRAGNGRFELWERDRLVTRSDRKAS
jgi:hypothetical protein